MINDASLDDNKFSCPYPPPPELSPSDERARRETPRDVGVEGRKVRPAAHLKISCGFIG